METTDRSRNRMTVNPNLEKTKPECQPSEALTNQTSAVRGVSRLLT